MRCQLLPLGEIGFACRKREPRDLDFLVVEPLVEDVAEESVRLRRTLRIHRGFVDMTRAGTAQHELPDERNKMRQLVLYVSKRMESNPGFGQTILNKVLMHADFAAWACVEVGNRDRATIPYESVFWSPRSHVSPEQQQHARALAEEFDLV
jgi:hypothetical protein